MPVSEVQKAAQAKYDKKTKTIQAKYTPADMEDYERLQKYLEQTGQNANSFIKNLINRFFEEEKQKNKPTPTIISRDIIDEKINQQESFYPFECIEYENLKAMYDLLGKVEFEETLQGFYDEIEPEVNNVIEEYGSRVNDFVEDYLDRIEDEEYKGMSKTDIFYETYREHF